MNKKIAYIAMIWGIITSTQAQVDSSKQAMDCHATATQCLAMTENNAASKKVDSSKQAQSLNKSLALGFAMRKQGVAAVSLVNRGFQARGEGSYLVGNDRDPSEEPTIYRAKPTPKTQKAQFSNAQTISQPAKDSRICDEKCGLQGKSQGSYLSGDLCDFSPLPHLSRKAESSNEQPTLDTSKLELIISYKAQAHDGIITGERYSIADPITLKAHRLRVAYTCSINTPINDLITDDEVYAIKYILTHYQEEVLECLRKGRANIRYDGLTSHNTRVLDSTTFAFPPQRILAHLDNRYLIIEVLKE